MRISYLIISCVLLLLLPACNSEKGSAVKPGFNFNRSLLHPDDFKHYIDLFNRMEDENIANFIPNDHAWEWMNANIPLFECPQDNFEEIYYFRWWTLRKHIVETPSGFAFTEFLVPRSYADKYNLKIGRASCRVRV